MGGRGGGRCWGSGGSDKAGSWRTDPPLTSDSEQRWSQGLEDLGLRKFVVGKGWGELELVLELERVGVRIGIRVRES